MIGKALISPYAFGVLSRIGGQVLAFVSVMVASRYLDLANFGSYVLAWTVTVISTSLVYTGFYQAQLRSSAPDHDASSYFWLMSLVALTGASVSALLGLASGGLDSQTGTAFLLLAPIVVLAVPTAWNEAHLVTDQRIRSASGYTLVSESAALIATWIALEQGLGLLALIAGRYAAGLTGLAVTTVLVRRRPRLELTRRALSDSRRTVPNLWGTSALAMFSNYGGDLILGAFLSPAAVGAYRGGARITQTVSDFVLQPLTMLSWSRFSRLERANDLDGMRAAWGDNMAVTGALIWPMMVSLAMLAEPLVTVVFDATWLPAAGAVVILAISRSLRFLGALLEPAMICTGHNRRQLQIRFAGAAVFLVALLTVGRLSVELAAMSHLLASATVAVFAVLACVRALEVETSALPRVFLPALLIAVGCAGVITVMAPIGDRMGTAPGLFVTIGALALFWCLSMVAALRLGWLKLPQP